MRFKLYNTAVCNIYIYYIIKIENIYIYIYVKPDSFYFLFVLGQREDGGRERKKVFQSSPHFKRIFSNITCRLRSGIFSCLHSPSW